MVLTKQGLKKQNTNSKKYLQKAGLFKKSDSKTRTQAARKMHNTIQKLRNDKTLK